MTKEEKARQVWMCTFCGAPYETEREAEQCWESHTELTWEPVWGGIGSGSDMPVECIIKKMERGYITEIAVYVLKDLKKGLKMRVKTFGEKK